LSKTVEIKMHEPVVQPEEGDWYQVQVFFRDTSPYAGLFGSEPAWRNSGRGATTLEGVIDAYVEAKELYAQVRVIKTNTTIITEDVTP
jgi:hypothetical protein